jgi:adenosine/AMP kinase
MQIVDIDKPDDVNVIVGMTHFIKTVDDIHESMVGTVPGESKSRQLQLASVRSCFASSISPVFWE